MSNVNAPRPFDPAAMTAEDEACFEAHYAMSPEEEAYYEEQMARGELAFKAEEMECYECNDFTGHGVTRKVVALGKIVNPVDPTQSYRLECGHTAI